MRSREKTDAIALLGAINETQARGEEGARADPAMAAREAGLEVGSERYRGAMAYLLDQHARGYASYFFTGRALALLKDRNGD